MAKVNWIRSAINPAKKGALHAQLGIKQSERIPEEALERAAGAGGKLGQRARFAETLEGFNKKKSPFSKVKVGSK